MQKEQACTLAVEIENLGRPEKETAAGAALNIRGARSPAACIRDLMTIVGSSRPAGADDLPGLTD